MTDTLNRTTVFNFDGSGRLSSVKRPSSAGNDVTISYDSNNRVSSVAVAGRTTNYTWSLSGSVLTGVASDGAGAVRTTTADTGSSVVLTEKDGLNRTTTYGYDSYGRRTSVLLPEGDKFEFTYDARGNITETRRKAKTGSGLADIVLSAGYDATCSNPLTCNKPNWTQDAGGNQTDYTYHAASGQLLTVTAPAATTGGTRPKTTYTYSSKYAWYKNASGSLVQAPTSVWKLTATSTCLTGATCAGTADERKTVITYQAGSSSVASNILPISTSLKTGDNSIIAATAMAYNDVGDVISIDGPLSGTGDTTAYKYDALRRRVGVIGPDPDGAGALPNQASRVTYDAKGRVTSVEQGTTAGQTDAAFTAFSPATKVASTYDDADRKLTETLQNGSTAYAKTQYSYDARGRLECAAARMNPTVYGSLPPTACTLGTTGAFGPDRITKYTYNLADEPTQIQSGYNGSTAQSTEKRDYTDNGRLSYVIDGNNNRTTYEYDGHDRLSKTRYPVATKGSNASSTTDYEQLGYDAASNITSVRLRDGGMMSLTYDKLNRLASRTPPGEPVVNFTYNLLGQRASVQRPSDGNNNSYTWDALGRLTSEAQAFGTMSYQYDAAGNRTRLTWGDGFYVTYDYDKAYRVTKIRENGASSGVGVLATYSYDSLGRRSGVTYGNGTSRSYAWDLAGRLSGLQIDLAGTANDLTIGKVGTTGTAIAYNPAYQITSLARNNDAYAHMGRYNVSRAYTANGLNQYTAAGGVSFGYDARGNLTSSGTSSYTYSKLNELKSGPGASLFYDALGRLHEYDTSVSTRMYYAGADLVAEVSNPAGTIERRYVPGPGTDEIVVWYEGSGTTDRRWLQADERGSVIAVSDASGNALQINTYDEYGIPGASNLGRFQYTGQTWYPEIGLYNYKARMYSPTLGRFMQTDPIGYADGINWYNYTGGDPINATDPSGTAWQLCGDTGNGQLTCAFDDSGSYYDGPPIVVDGNPSRFCDSFLSGCNSIPVNTAYIVPSFEVGSGISGGSANAGPKNLLQNRLPTPDEIADSQAAACSDPAIQAALGNPSVQAALKDALERTASTGNEYAFEYGRSVFGGRSATSVYGGGSDQTAVQNHFSSLMSGIYYREIQFHTHPNPSGRGLSYGPGSDLALSRGGWGVVAVRENGEMFCAAPPK